MNRNNHLFIWSRTDLGELDRKVQTHWDSMSYLKIGSSALENVDVKRVCDIVKWSAISVCLGGWVLDETVKAWKWKRFFWRRFSDVRKLAKLGVDAIEISSLHLWDKDMVKFAQDYFNRRVVEVGVKSNCMHPLNSPTRMLAWILEAEEIKPDHIVLEGAISSEVGIYHVGSRNPNILAVDQLREAITDSSRCIIEASYFRELNLWRLIYWPETHIGNIDEFENINPQPVNNYEEGHWDNLRTFRKRLQKICTENDFLWDEVARNEELNVHIIHELPKLAQLSDEELLSILREHLFDDPFAMIRMLMGQAWIHEWSVILPPMWMMRFWPGVVFMWDLWREYWEDDRDGESE